MPQKTVAIAALALAAAIAMAPTGSAAQNQRHFKPCTWDEFAEMFSTSYFDDGESTQTSAERMDMLRNLYDNKTDINSATREELLELPFITEGKADAIVGYIQKNGPMRSPGELALIPQLDYLTRRMLTAFVFCGERRETAAQGIRRMLDGKHTVATGLSTPLYTAEGYKSHTPLKPSRRYLGDKARVAVKYAYNHKNELMFGVTGEKDSGEPLACRGNKLLDSYSLYIYRRQREGKYCAAIGDFRIHFGEGLTTGNLFHTGKKSAISENHGNRQTITPHTSHSERDFFRGVAGSLRMGRLVASAFFSRNTLDAVPADSGGVSSISPSGYHRTLSEMARRGNLRNTTAGADLTYALRTLKAGLSATATRYSRNLEPRRAEYNRHAMRGKAFHAVSAHYALALRAFTSRGEAAVSEKGALAMVNTVRWKVSNRLSLASVQRSYSMKYSQPHAESFRSSGKVSNEQGIYTGFNANLSRSLSLCGYADFFRSPWPSYSYRSPVNGMEFYAEASLRRTGWFASADFKLTRRESHNPLSRHDTVSSRRGLARLRLGTAGERLSTLTALSLTSAAPERGNRHQGWALSHRAVFSAKKIKANLSASYFDAKNYAARIYVYESNVRYTYNNFIPLYGRGIRAAATASVKIGRALEVYAKYGMTHYFDRRQTGSGAARVDGRTRSSVAFCINATI